LYHDQTGKGIKQEYWKQKPPPRRLEVAPAIRQTANGKATGLDKVPTKKVQSRRRDNTGQNALIFLRSGKLVRGERNGRSFRLSHFPRKVIVNSVQITVQ